MKSELCCDNNCLDLPSLTQIQCGWGNFNNMGCVVLESMIYFSYYYGLDIPNLTENNISHNEVFKNTADLQATCTFSSLFHFTH